MNSKEREELRRQQQRDFLKYKSLGNEYEWEETLLGRVARLERIVEKIENIVIPAKDFLVGIGQIITNAFEKAKDKPE